MVYCTWKREFQGFLICDVFIKLEKNQSHVSGLMGKFILTGSQNFLLLEKISQSLAVRVAVLHLMPFGLPELIEAKAALETLDETLFKGFYPVLYDRPIQPVDYYPSYIQTYIERDVRSIKKAVLSEF